MSLNLPTKTFTIEDLGTNRSLVTAVSLPSNGTAALLRDNSYGYYLEFYDGQGNAITQNINLRTLASNEASNVSYTEFNILGLSNGNVLVYYNSRIDNSVDNAYFFVVDSNGNEVVSDTQLNVLTGDSQTRFINAVNLDNGNVAFSYQGSNNADILSKVINPINGSTVVNEFKAFAAVGTSTQSIVYSENKIAAGQNGGYVIITAYHDNVLSPTAGYVVGGNAEVRL